MQLPAFAFKTHSVSWVHEYFPLDRVSDKCCCERCSVEWHHFMTNPHAPICCKKVLWQCGVSWETLFSLSLFFFSIRLSHPISWNSSWNLKVWSRCVRVNNNWIYFVSLLQRCVCVCVCVCVNQMWFFHLLLECVTPLEFQISKKWKWWEEWKNKVE